MAPLSLIRRPNPFNFPGTLPGFDPGHVASMGITSGGAGLSAVVSANASGTNPGFMSLVSGKKSAQAGTTSFSMQSTIGPSIVFNTGGNDSCTFSAQPTVTSPLTSITYGCIFSVITLSGAYQGLVAYMNGDSPFVINATSQLEVFGSAAINSLIVPVVNTPYFAAVSARNATTANFVLVNLANGSVKTAVIATAVTLTVGAGTFTTIGNNNTTNQNAKSRIAAAMFAPNLFLSMPQLQLWAADPWSFWYPRGPELLVVAAAAVIPYSAFYTPQHEDGRAITQMVGY